MFDKQQIMEFKEVFDRMDTNEDGVLCGSDLDETFHRLGITKKNALSLA